MGENGKRRRGDRKDAKLVRGLDPMHIFMPFLLPGRCDNEAVLVETIDLSEVNRYLEGKNKEDVDFKYTFFHVICAAIAKTLMLRPRMNYFIAGNRYYEKNAISLAFVVKKQFTDNGAEALAIIEFDKNEMSPIDQIHDKVRDFVFKVRNKDETDGATDVMSVLTKLPKFLLKIAVGLIVFLENHGILPYSLVEDDPYHASVFLSNLGSIKLSANYHHLANFGTNSIFAVIGEKGMRPFFSDDGSYEMRDALTLSLTIDERIADGVYFSKSIKILRYLLSHPDLLDMPMNSDIDIEL